MSSRYASEKDRPPPKQARRRITQESDHRRQTRQKQALDYLGMDTLKEMNARLFATAATLCATVGVILCGPTNAQEAKPKAATQEEVLAYNQMGAINTCYLTIQENVNFEKGLRASLIMIGEVLTKKHGSLIEGSGSQPLRPEAIQTGTTIQLAAIIKNMCSSKFTGESKKQFEKFFGEIESFVKKNQPPQK